MRARTIAVRTLLGALAAVALAAPTPADAAELRLEGTTLVYIAGAGETNGLGIFESGDGGPPPTPPPGGAPRQASSRTLEIDESAGTIVAEGPACSGGGSRATCSGVMDSLRIELKDGNDGVTLYLDAPLPSTIDGGSGEDDLRGHLGPDAITAGDGRDALFGNGGNDVLEGGDDDDRLRGDEPYEFVPPTLVGDPGNDIVRGGRGSDQLDGGFGNDEVSGGDGDDTYAAATQAPSFCPGAQPPCPAPPNDGADTFSGGAGRDRATYALADAAVFVSLDGVRNDGETDESDDIGGDVEDVTGGPGGDVLSGNDSPNELAGGAGDDRLSGGGDADTLSGGEGDAGSDILAGGGGGDTLDGGPADDRLEGDSGDDRLDGDSGQDQLDGGEDGDIVEGGPGSDPTVNGGEGDDQVYGANRGETAGADGSDTLAAGGGDDAMFGGPANDMLDGGGGSDIVNGGDGDDTAMYRRATRVRVTLDGRSNDGSRRERDNVALDVESADTGSSDDDLIGNGGQNTLTGGEGADYLEGGGGVDSLFGGGATDVVRSVDRGADQVDCGAGPAPDYVIADREDSAQGCRRLSNGRGARPLRGRRFVLSASRSRAAFAPPGLSRTVVLKDRLALPMGSLVDARRTSVTVTAARRRPERGVFRGSRFRVRQARGSGLTTLTLTGGDFSVCRGVRGKPVQSARRVRRLFGRARGRYRSRGRHSHATVRGTGWTVTDRCNGTLTTVQSGTVTVFDFAKRRRIVLRSGERYFAHAP